MKAISNELLDRFRSEYDSDSHARTMTAAASKTDITDLAYLPMEAAKLSGPFRIEVRTRGITAQEKSGRCWAYPARSISRQI